MENLKMSELDQYVDMYIEYLDAMPPEELQTYIETGIEEIKKNWTEVKYTPKPLVFECKPRPLGSYIAEYGYSDEVTADNNDQNPVEKAA